MPFVEQSHEFSVALEDIALISGRSVSVHLVGIEQQATIVDRRGTLCGLLTQAVRHDEQLPDIVPVQPEGKQVLAVVDPVGDDPVNLNNMP